MFGFYQFIIKIFKFIWNTFIQIPLSIFLFSKTYDINRLENDIKETLNNKN